MYMKKKEYSPIFFCLRNFFFFLPTPETYWSCYNISILDFLDYTIGNFEL